MVKRYASEHETAREKYLEKLAKEKKHWLILSFVAVFVCALALFAGTKTRSVTQYLIAALFAYVTAVNFRQYKQKKAALRAALESAGILKHMRK